MPHLNLVDSAGSENAAQSGTMEKRLKEGSFIDKSLFLGRVISTQPGRVIHQLPRLQVDSNPPALPG